MSQLEHVVQSHHYLKVVMTSPTTGVVAHVWHCPPNNITVGIVHEAARHQHKSAPARWYVSRESCRENGKITSVSSNTLTSAVFNTSICDLDVYFFIRTWHPHVQSHCFSSYSIKTMSCSWRYRITHENYSKSILIRQSFDVYNKTDFKNQISYRTLFITLRQRI